MSHELWHAKLSWFRTALEDLEFWSGSFGQYHGQPFWRKRPTRVTELSWSDTGDSGWGGFSVRFLELWLEAKTRHHTAKGAQFTKGEWAKSILQASASASSTWRELRAILVILISLSKEIEDGVCIQRTDNQAAVRIIQAGSSKPHLQRKALEIHKPCTEN